MMMRMINNQSPRIQTCLETSDHIAQTGGWQWIAANDHHDDDVHDNYHGGDGDDDDEGDEDDDGDDDDDDDADDGNDHDDENLEDIWLWKF